MSLEKDIYRLQITLVFVKIKNSSHLQTELHFDNTHISKQKDRAWSYHRAVILGPRCKRNLLVLLVLRYPAKK